MYSSIIASAAMLLAIAPLTVSAGTAYVVNNCGSEVYFASVAQSAHSDMEPLPSSGYSESYGADGVGVSIKLSPSEGGQVTQFEFTKYDGNIAFDISNIDGNPFASGGMSLTPSMAGADGFPTCQTVSCPGGQAHCEAAYNLPDDVRTMVCPEASDLTMTLCPGGPSKREEEPAPVVLRSHGHRMHARQWR